MIIAKCTVLNAKLAIIRQVIQLLSFYKELALRTKFKQTANDKFNANFCPRRWMIFWVTAFKTTFR